MQLDDVYRVSKSCRAWPSLKHGMLVTISGITQLDARYGNYVAIKLNWLNDSMTFYLRYKKHLNNATIRIKRWNPLEYIEITKEQK